MAIMIIARAVMASKVDIRADPRRVMGGFGRVMANLLPKPRHIPPETSVSNPIGYPKTEGK
jgi:hypothetical protein